MNIRTTIKTGRKPRAIPPRNPNTLEPAVTFGAARCSKRLFRKMRTNCQINAYLQTRREAFYRRSRRRRTIKNHFLRNPLRNIRLQGPQSLYEPESV